MACFHCQYTRGRSSHSSCCPANSASYPQPPPPSVFLILMIIYHVNAVPSGFPRSGCLRTELVRISGRRIFTGRLSFQSPYQRAPSAQREMSTIPADQPAPIKRVNDHYITVFTPRNIPGGGVSASCTEDPTVHQRAKSTAA